MPHPPTRHFLIAVAVVGTAVPSTSTSPLVAQDTFEVTAQTSGTDVLLQAISPVDERIVWISGHGGTWGRTLDGGEQWSTGTVTGATELEFRDVEGFDASSAVLLAAGPGDRSRIFRTDDGGATWTETWVMAEPEGFLDCMDFIDPTRGFAYGDAIAGQVYLLETRDGGRSWSRIPAAGLPAALESEGGFAASGDCVATALGATVLVATGNGPEPRLIRSDDAGHSWSVSTLPLTAGPSAGATAVGIEDDAFGWAVGGAIGPPLPGARVATSSDGGASWLPAPDPPLDGALYGADVSRTVAGRALVVVGPGGIAATSDGGATWQNLTGDSHWAIAFAPDGSGWAVGPGGRVSRLRPRRRTQPKERS
jgi:photosystem II stability/assembly factor-like uncharacterized protein